MKTSFFLLLLILPCSGLLQAQSTPFVENCLDAGSSCLGINGLSGNTSGFLPDTLPKSCGLLQNDQWISFMAADSFGIITVSPSACFNGDGVQITLYNTCTGDYIACNGGGAGSGTTPVSISANFVIGQHYILVIDGYSADVCNFQITTTPAGLSADTCLVATHNLQNTALDLKIFPNPVAPGFPVQINMPENWSGQHARLDFYSGSGRLWYSLNDVQLNSRYLRLNLPANAPSGISMLRVTSDSGSGTARLMILMKSE